jgi:hypothetical protein
MRGFSFLVLAAAVVATGCSSNASNDTSTFTGGDTATDLPNDGTMTVDPGPCDPSGGYRSAVLVAGAADPALVKPFADTLKGAGYQAVYWDPAAAPDPGPDPVPPPPSPQQAFTGAVDALGERVFLFANGDLVVASYCGLDDLGQARRLDYALAAASELLAGQQPTLGYVDVTRRWAQPTAWFTQRAGQYWRQYLPESIDLNQQHTGKLAFSQAPSGAGFGLYGHADIPSKNGDVVGVDSLLIGGKSAAAKSKISSTAQVALAWDILPFVGAGEHDWVARLFVADASIEWKVGFYLAFFEAAFPMDAKSPTFNVTQQGSLPGTLKVSKALTEIDLPAKITLD